jgi:hypothetical protein
MTYENRRMGETAEVTENLNVFLMLTLKRSEEGTSAKNQALPSWLAWGSKWWTELRNAISAIWVDGNAGTDLVLGRFCDTHKSSRQGGSSILQYSADNLISDTQSTSAALVAAFLLALSKNKVDQRERAVGVCFHRFTFTSRFF